MLLLLLLFFGIQLLYVQLLLYLQRGIRRMSPSIQIVLGLKSVARAQTIEFIIEVIVHFFGPTTMVTRSALFLQSSRRSSQHIVQIYYIGVRVLLLERGVSPVRGHVRLRKRAHIRLAVHINNRRARRNWLEICHGRGKLRLGFFHVDLCLQRSRRCCSI